MKFTKPALAIEDQIALLERRGMAVPDRQRASHYLRHISYYRLRAYLLPFETAGKVNGDHVFAEGVSFDDAWALYIFDRQLRLLLIDAIERMEVSLRAGWAHHMALKYGPHGYLDPELYAPRQHEKTLASLGEEIRRSRDTFIIHYQNKYSDPPMPPIWMAAELMSLGQLSKWLSHLKFAADRKAIARPYGIDESVLLSFLHHLTNVRNICAHHGRLWNRQFTFTMKLPKSPASLVLVMNKNAPRRLYNTLTLIGWFMEIIAPGSEWKRHIVELIDGFPQADPVAMGFPDNWRSFTMWKILKE